ncbi:hypothetical protein DSM106972_026260 [Dulcicalothrix desertica PCC 7102]|uniref:TonB-dependent receptor-like beta-barrel domain-containing protein n=1 Tax=Dulcicalothrix desertica PCC 7102 TaxID=232991 RepID=A0A3S1DCH1_9CYAN|nr:TonB-dependent receptor [Dulcicalothrix desertica]RUT07365.1 hypothetical protein DSM106972_026260 [Dulcicalothrix desertica PCC 7102]TWH55440.1 TonB-dependent receptor-like protein [Dulcicalothrix desertica PCC 7102]
MALTISVEEFYNQIFQVEENNISPYQTVEIPLNDPKKLSQGYRRSIEICPGLDFLIDDYTLQEDLTVEVADGTPGSDLELSFSILGDNYCENTPCGQNFLSSGWSLGEGGLFKWQAGSRILKFDIHLEVPFFQALIANEIEQLPQQMRRVMDVEGEPDYCHFAKTTPAMQNLINQIFNCPYQGITRRLYLESKALELIALRLEQIKSDSSRNISSSLKPDDVDRIYSARDILINNLDKPPSLPQKVDNYEIGVRGNWNNFQASIAGFYSESELGTTLVENPALPGTLLLARAPQRNYGVEAAIDWQATKSWQLGGSFTWQEGENDIDGDGNYQALNSGEVSPIKLTAYLQNQTTPGWRNRLQALYVGDRNRGFEDGSDNGPIRSYFVLDYISSIKIGAGTIDIGVENLLNNQYTPALNQFQGDFLGNSYRFPARGTTLRLNYRINW